MPAAPVMHPAAYEKPAFSIALPAPFTDADTLQFLAASYAAGKSESADISMAKGLLSSAVSRTTAQWLLARNGIPLPFGWYQNFRETAPDWPESAGWKRRIEISLLTSQMADAEKAKYLSANPPQTTAGRIFMGKQLLAANRKQEAVDMVRPVWVQEKLLEATERQIRTDYIGLLTQQDHRQRMISLMAGKNWDAALRAAKDAGDTAEALVKTRMAVMTNAKDAQNQLDALPKAAQDDSLALFSRFLLLTRQKKTKEATDFLVRLTTMANTMPITSSECHDWQTQQRTLTRNLLESKDFNTAYQAASASLSTRGCIHNDADFLAGWIALRFIDRPEDARRHFETLSANADNASRKARADYWLARTFERLGDRSKADLAYRQAARYWNSFYGQLAADNLSVPTPVPASEPPVPDEARQKLERSTAWQAIRLLDAGGAMELSLPLYTELASILPDKPHLDALGALAVELRNARATLAISRIASQRGIDLGTSAYPVFGLPELKEKTSTADQALLYTITRQESAFNPKARSSTGSLGLMQLMPGTARMTAERNGLVYNSDRLTQDPAYNIRLGMAHFGALQTEWRGSYILSFAAYNAGSGNVRKWIAANGDPRTPDIDAVDWIESIPFMETRHYVQRLTESLIVYRNLMGMPLATRIR